MFVNTNATIISGVYTPANYAMQKTGAASQAPQASFSMFNADMLVQLEKD